MIETILGLSIVVNILLGYWLYKSDRLRKEGHRLLLESDWFRKECDRLRKEALAELKQV